MELNELKDLYKPVVFISRGGQKMVYRGKNSSGESIVIKLINSDKDLRVLQEIEILKDLDIKNVPKILDTGTVYDSSIDEYKLYIIEECIDGESLRQKLSSGNILSLTEACNLLETLLQIEVELENKGIIHRDIKPENIIVGNDNKIYLLDFGIAKILGGTSLTLTSAASGPHTPGYAPQELVHNIKLDQDNRLDLFQIGVTVYESCTGTNPFSEKAHPDRSMIDLYTMTYVPEQLNMVGDTKGLFGQLISILMAKVPSRRPGSAKEALRYFNIVKASLILEV